MLMKNITPKEEVESLLESNPYKNNLRGVKVREEFGQIILFGKVKTYFMKQVVLTIVQKVAKPACWQDRISVEKNGESLHNYKFPW